MPREALLGFGSSLEGSNMRNWLLALGCPLALALACSGKSVSSKGNQPTQASVEASLPSWCQSTCKKLVACDVDEDCVCEGDACACGGGVEDPAECAENCRDQLTEGARLSQACARAIDQFKRCVDANGCAVVRGEVCDLKELEGCEEDGDDIDNRPPSAEPVPSGTGGTYGPGPSPPPMVGTAGASYTPAYPGIPGTAGTSSGGPTPVGPAVRCNSGGGSASAAPPPAGPQVICEQNFGDCSNGSSYYAVCVTTSAGQSSCSCFVDNQLSTAFDPGGTCPSVMQLNLGCGWNLQ